MKPSPHYCLLLQHEPTPGVVSWRARKLHRCSTNSVEYRYESHRAAQHRAKTMIALARLVAAISGREPRPFPKVSVVRVGTPQHRLAQRATFGHFAQAFRELHVLV